MNDKYASQIETVIRLLDGRKLGVDTPVFKKTLEWLDYASKGTTDRELLERLLVVATHSFDLTQEQLLQQVAGVEFVPTEPSNNGHTHVDDSEDLMRSIIPKGGWLEAYAEYTKYTESPLSYHIFSGMCALGAALGRRVFLRMGFFDIFPNYCVVLIGPTGRVKKTSAVDIAKKFVTNNNLCPIVADAITPEALGTALARDGGQQLVYAPEFAVLFNRQKYNEALTTRIIRLLDCPETFTVETQARGKEDIKDVALGFLGCSTPSLFTGATPEMVTSSGFLNRFLLVVETDTNREFPVPARGEDRHAATINSTLKRMKKLSGEVEISPVAFAHYKQWYHERKIHLRTVTDEVTAEVMERGAAHLLRTAMLVHVAEHGDNLICPACMETGLRLLNFVERKTPWMVANIRQSQRDAGAEHILAILRRGGGVLDHSTLLRKSRMDAQTFKRDVTTLLEQRTIREDKRGTMRLYILNEPAAEGGTNGA